MVIIRGRLARNGAQVGGQLLPAYETGGAIDLTAGQSGEWALVVRDAAGAILGRYPFEPDWSGADLERERNVIGFQYRIPALAGLRHVELVGPGGLLDARTWSAHAPTVSITSPKTNTVSKPIGGKVSVTWTGRDSDGDKLLSSVLVSKDGGKTFEAQSVEGTGSTFGISVDAGFAYRVKVVVTDGARSAESTIDFSSETPAQLVARIAAAYRAGTGATLLGRLDPAVIARYGASQYRSFLASVKIPTLRYTVVSQSGPAPWFWLTDVKSSRIPAAYSLAVDRTVSGVKTRITIHIAIRSGRLSCFADCGRPI